MLTLTLWLSGLARATPAEGEVCGAWDLPSAGSVRVDEVEESSGVAVGRTSRALYTLEDAGNDPVLHILDLDRGYLGRQVVRGATNTDWEDLAAGPCPSNVLASSCLWIADTGDNDEVRDAVVMWVVPESMDAGVDAVACRLRYPDDEPHDAEAAFVDPEGVLRVVTKERDGEAHVYALASPACDGSVEALVEEAELDPGAPITGGAMSADGATTVLRSLDRVWIWQGCELDWAAEPTTFALEGQEQGEAVALGPNGDMVTTSEGAPFEVWSAPCAETTPLVCEGCGCASTGAPRSFVWAALGMLVVVFLRREAHTPESMDLFGRGFPARDGPQTGPSSRHSFSRR